MIFVDNLQKIRQLTSGLDVTLIAASKTQSKATIDELMRLAPEFELGENRVQEFVDKYDERYVWHIIGRLQTNKVKYVVGKVRLIHSLDRLELADEIERQAAKRNLCQACLVEVNIAGEQSKGGVPFDEAKQFVESMRGYEHISVEGIMCVMPNTDDIAMLDGLYTKLKKLFEELKALEGDNISMRYLSAGMSNDWEIALRHGANMLRLGRFLFGERDAAIKQP